MELKLVSKEIAFQLKELGFDWCCEIMFLEKGLKRPSQALVIKWFRDLYQISIDVKLLISGNYYCVVRYFIGKPEEFKEIVIGKCKTLNGTGVDELEEAGILKAIEILKERNNESKN